MGKVSNESSITHHTVHIRESLNKAASIREKVPIINELREVYCLLFITLIEWVNLFLICINSVASKEQFILRGTYRFESDVC